MLIRRWEFLWSAGSIALGICLACSHLGAAKTSDPAGEKPTSLSIDTGHPGQAPPDQETLLVGPEARQQLVVTAGFSSGRHQDFTHRVSYQARPADVVQIDATGWVTPVGNGGATITVRSLDGLAASRRFRVQDVSRPRQVNFPNEIVPIFTKLGCNSGACHGKSSGQNGFRLSLLGFEPQEDYEHLVKEGRGRRLFPAAPSQSLLLAKVTADLPHGGGLRIEEGSRDFGLLHRWIAQGMPYGEPGDPTLARIAVFPRERVMDPGQEQQLLVKAHYSDGSARDVTRSVHYEPNEAAMAEVSPTGLVQIGEVMGNLAIMMRFQDRVDVFRATVPLGAAVGELPAPRNYIDQLVFQKLRTLGLPPAESCDDQTFMRRTAIHIAGRLPRLDETRAFLDNPDADKREKWVDSLLAGPDYADYFANKWSAILRNKRRRYYARGNYVFHDWIRRSLDANKPYDQFAREIVTASGEMGRNPPVAWYREASDATQQVEDTAQVFLGIRLQCARCHHHPLEKWSQRDYYGFAAFFSRVSRKKGSQPGEETIFHERGTAVATDPKTRQPLAPTPLGGSALELSPDQDPREVLADWMTSRDNPFFARMVANRYWKHFFGRGLVEPEDDMRLTNPASHPELLEALAIHFIDGGYDLKKLIRTICRSRVYQFSSHPNSHNGSDDRNFSRRYPRRLPAEVLLDAIDQIAGTETKFPGQPAGTRAVQLPDDSFNSEAYFLPLFGRPDNTTACECERTEDANLAQSLHLLNSPHIHEKLTAGQARAALLAADPDRTHEEKIRELYHRAYAREPDTEELATATQHVEGKGKGSTGESPEAGLREAYEDILWALINTKEFIFNH